MYAWPFLPPSWELNKAGQANKPTKMKDKQLSVSAIKEGTVIDHIPASALFKVVSILDLKNLDNMITIGNSLGSNKLGKKGIIKLSNIFFKDDEINKIALVAPWLIAGAGGDVTAAGVLADILRIAQTLRGN